LQKVKVCNQCAPTCWTGRETSKSKVTFSLATTLILNVVRKLTKDRLKTFTNILIVLILLTSCNYLDKPQESSEKNKEKYTAKPFPNLYEITNSNDSLSHLYVDKDKAEVINKKLKDLDKNHPLFKDIDCESEMTLLAITPLNNSKKKYAIIYGNCPEPEFHIYAEDDLTKFYGSIGGLNLYINGNNNLYVSGHINSNFNIKRKLKFEENNIKEVKQPNYYVGLKTVTLKPITLYKSKDLKNTVATLPKNYKIEVLLSQTSHKSEDYYLIKTEFGLIGWTKIKAGQYQSIDIKGIYWNGD